MSDEPVLRIHQTRSRANPGGMDVKKVLGEDVLPFRSRKPAWFKVPRPGSAKYRELSKTIADEGLHTVCKEAACPNIGDCWDRGTATFMILGDTCTRRCGFCNVKTGKPTWNDPLEPLRVARSVARMNLRHAVITSVDRDDLPDYGAKPETLGTLEAAGVDHALIVLPSGAEADVLASIPSLG